MSAIQPVAARPGGVRDLSILAKLSCALARARGCSMRYIVGVIIGAVNAERFPFDPHGPGARRLAELARMASSVRLTVVQDFVDGQEGRAYAPGDQLERSRSYAEGLAASGVVRFANRFAGPS